MLQVLAGPGSTFPVSDTFWVSLEVSSVTACGPYLAGYIWQENWPAGPGWGRANEVRLRKVENLNQYFLFLMGKKTVRSLFICVLSVYSFQRQPHFLLC